METNTILAVLIKNRILVFTEAVIGDCQRNFRSKGSRTDLTHKVNQTIEKKRMNRT